jgi:hypothetical protein
VEEEEKSLGLGDRNRSQQRGFEQAEDRRVRADADVGNCRPAMRVRFTSASRTNGTR